MIAVVKSAGSTLANGALQFVYQTSKGVLTDVFSASFQILSENGVQLFPVTPGTKQTINVAAAGPSRLGVGRYAALWTPDGSLDTGDKYFVRWFYVVSSGGAEQTFDQEFELVEQPYKGGDHLCSLYDLKDEGITITSASKAQQWIARASRYIEHYTGRRFAPKHKTIEIDGRGGFALMLNEPIVALEKVVMNQTSVFSLSSESVDLSNVKVANRHLTQALTNPDDRNNPKLEYVRGLDIGNTHLFPGQGQWDRGTRNVQVIGIFGYTEPDGSFVGQTPDLIREACKMLVIKNMTPLASAQRDESYRVTRERTKDQEVEYAPPAKQPFTGDRVIDSILVAFRRMPTFGAA